MISSYLLEVKKTSKDIFNVLSLKSIYFSYFYADGKYYLFLYSRIIHDFEFFYQKIEIIKQLDFRRRQIRSTRGFLLFALEIKEKSKEFKVIKTNLSKFFWENVERVINQNKKQGLENFLVGKELELELEFKQNFQIKIENLVEKIEFLENRLIKLENQNKVSGF